MRRSTLEPTATPGRISRSRPNRRSLRHDELLRFARLRVHADLRSAGDRRAARRRGRRRARFRQLREAIVAYWLVEQGGATTLPQGRRAHTPRPKVRTSLSCLARRGTRLHRDELRARRSLGITGHHRAPGRALSLLGGARLRRRSRPLVPRQRADRRGVAARPELFAAPITTFARLGLSEFLVVDETGTAQLVRNGVVSAFDTGTSERIVSLKAGDYRNAQEWAGRTESGKLVRGSLAGGRACSATAEPSTSTTCSASSSRTSAFVNASGSYCSRTALPSGTLDVGFIGSASPAPPSPSTADASSPRPSFACSTERQPRRRESRRPPRRREQCPAGR